MKPGDWWDKSWSIVTGCSWPEGAMPPACEHCWARGMLRRFSSLGHPNAVTWHPGRLDAPLRRRKPTVWAVSLLGDLFHPDVPRDFRRAVWRTMTAAPQHHYVLLTKRWRTAARELRDEGLPTGAILMASAWDQRSVSDAAAALAPLGIRWGLHLEPLLGPVNLDFVAGMLDGCPGQYNYLSGDWWPALGDAAAEAEGRVWIGESPAWIVVGGENGPGARPMDPDWARQLREECVSAGVPFWLKCLGRGRGRILDGRTWEETPW